MQIIQPKILRLKMTKRIELCKANEAILRRQYVGTATKN